MTVLAPRREASKNRDDYALCSWDGGNLTAAESPTDTSLATIDEQHSPSDIALLQPFSSLVTRTTASTDATALAPRECRRIVSDSLEAKVFDFFVKNAGPWVSKTPIPARPPKEDYSLG
jgi:hypothetical protein